MTIKTEHIKPNNGRELAVRYTVPNTKLSFVWFSGFKSDMSGSKVLALENWANEQGHGFLAFDYSGHGLSSGKFEDGTISDWRADALAAIEAKTQGPLIFVGSSMGGWLALLCALALGDRVKALTLIAPAPDFTDKLMWPEFTPAQQNEILETGRTLRPSDYDEPYIITRALIDDGKKWSLLDAPIPLQQPIRILQGMQDADVPWQHALRLCEALESEAVVLSLIKDGDHRLSRDIDIARLCNTCAELAAQFDERAAQKLLEIG